MAKQGTTNSEKYLHIGTPQAAINSEINKYIRDVWNEKWQAYSEGMHTKELS